MALAVYLYGRRVGTLQPGTATDYAFAYSETVVESADPGAVVLSHSLPVREEPFDPAATRAYFEGLLPESGRREELARELQVSVHDSYALLARVGRDCAGAVVILPEQERLESEAAGVNWLSEDRLIELVNELPRRPLGVTRASGKLRLSLAGVQRKLALVRNESGGFGEPVGDAPSTHLIKPEFGDEYPGLAVNEMFCMTVAGRIGLDAAKTALATIGDRTCLISSRFDRAEQDGITVRLHQEDLCQALGVPTNLKYEANSGPGFRHFHRVLGEIGRGGDMNAMVRSAVLNFVLGNSDAHGKNFAILFTRDGRRLAPLYDIVSTAVYDLDREMAMAIGGNFDPDSIQLADWLDMSAGCDLSPRRFFPLVRATATGIKQAVSTVRAEAEAEGWYAPVIAEVEAVARERADHIGEEIEERGEAT
ncbi:MAG TPA: HipA domain-containing protein [Solirubrobacterales bacterium]|nr:HipA domain-containing protein [Solirubrobacterales bacterium]